MDEPTNFLDEDRRNNLKDIIPPIILSQKFASCIELVDAKVLIEYAPPDILVIGNSRNNTAIVIAINQNGLYEARFVVGLYIYSNGIAIVIITGRII